MITKCNNCGAHIDSFNAFYGVDDKWYCLKCAEEDPIVFYLVWGADDDDDNEKYPSEKYSREIKEGIEELEDVIKILEAIKEPHTAQKYLLASCRYQEEELKKVLNKIKKEEEI